jgi:hypothetical protein
MKPDEHLIVGMDFRGFVIDEKLVWEAATAGLEDLMRALTVLLEEPPLKNK